MQNWQVSCKTVPKILPRYHDVLMHINFAIQTATNSLLTLILARMPLTISLPDDLTRSTSALVARQLAHCKYATQNTQIPSTLQASKQQETRPTVQQKIQCGIIIDVCKLYMAFQCCCHRNKFVPPLHGSTIYR